MKKILFMILVVMVALASCNVVPATVVGYELEDVGEAWTISVELDVTAVYSDGSREVVDSHTVTAVDVEPNVSLDFATMYEGFLTNTVTIYFNDWRFVGDWDFSPDYLLLNLNSDGSYSRIEDINNPVTINGTWETRSDTNLNGAPELYWSHSDKWYDYVYITGTPDKIDALNEEQYRRQ
jgi:hypothetical protein